jgi:putative proteasome-type protease
MTYCIAMTVDEGLVFVSDSRTNAGVDQLGTYSKMHQLLCNGERTFILLSSGNLGTTQGVLSNLDRDIKSGMLPNLATVPTLEEAAECIGIASTTEQQKHHQARKDLDGFKPGASFILGGQIRGSAPGIFLIYPEGNFVRATQTAPYHQIGEAKYGKPILERSLGEPVSLDTAARIGLISMDSTLHSNATVGPPIELLMYHTDSLGAGVHHTFNQDDPYWSEMRRTWTDNMRAAFARLPPLPEADQPSATVTRIDPNR